MDLIALLLGLRLFSHRLFSHVRSVATFRAQPAAMQATLFLNVSQIGNEGERAP